MSGLFAQVICGPLLLQARLTKTIGLPYKCIGPAQIQSPTACRPSARGQGPECPAQLGAAHSKRHMILLHRRISSTTTLSGSSLNGGCMHGMVTQTKHPNTDSFATAMYPPRGLYVESCRIYSSGLRLWGYVGLVGSAPIRACR